MWIDGVDQLVVVSDPATEDEIEIVGGGCHVLKLSILCYSDSWGLNLAGVMEPTRTIFDWRIVDRNLDNSLVSEARCNSF
jgi:hypothetical protein